MCVERAAERDFYRLHQLSPSDRENSDVGSWSSLDYVRVLSGHNT